MYGLSGQACPAWLRQTAARFIKDSTMGKKMKFIGFTFVLFLALSTSAYSQEAQASRFGTLRVVDTEGNLKHQLFLDDKEVFHYEGQSIEILEVFKGKAKDYLVVAANSGGKACPVQLVIIELSSSGKSGQSKTFGSCSDEVKTSFLNGKVIVETPMYAPHPELLSKRELKRRENLKEVYTWFQGKVVKRLKPR
jgi:hypothetical protein